MNPPFYFAIRMAGLKDRPVVPDLCKRGIGQREIERAGLSWNCRKREFAAIIEFRRCQIISSKNELMINEEIREKEIRVIDSDGSMLGIMSAKDAQKLANGKNLDLVKIAPQASPPVCKIMDYGKHMFEQAKKEKEARKNQKVINIKEVWLKPTIEEHDFNVKLKNSIKFLQDGDKVKVGVRFRGREMNYTSLGQQVLERFAEASKEVGIVEKRPKLEGKSMIMILNPKQ